MPGIEFCCYCGRIIVFPLELTNEHLVPVSKGGNNTLYNKRPCCNKCNTWRGNLTFELFELRVKAALRVGRKGYNLQDLQAMLENIQYIKHYVATAGEKLLRQKSYHLHTVRSVGTLQKKHGLAGYKVADIGHPVYETEDRYYIVLESLKEGKPVEIRFYKETLEPFIKLTK